MAKFDKAVGKKAAEGDEDAALDIVLDAPPDHMKEGEDPMSYAKRTDEAGGYGDQGPGFEEKVSAIESILDDHAVENARAIAEDLCMAIIEGRIPHVTSDLELDEGGGDETEQDDGEPPADKTFNF